MKKFSIFPDYKWTIFLLFNDKYDNNKYPEVGLPMKLVILVFVIICIAFGIR
jgi:hypothetical protein